jgi:hypothetical protein
MVLLIDNIASPVIVRAEFEFQRKNRDKNRYLMKYYTSNLPVKKVGASVIGDKLAWKRLPHNYQKVVIPGGIV